MRPVRDITYQIRRQPGGYWMTRVFWQGTFVGLVVHPSWAEAIGQESPEWDAFLLPALQIGEAA